MALLILLLLITNSINGTDLDMIVTDKDGKHPLINHNNHNLRETDIVINQRRLPLTNPLNNTRFTVNQFKGTTVT